MFLLYIFAQYIQIKGQSLNIIGRCLSLKLIARLGIVIELKAKMKMTSIYYGRQNHMAFIYIISNICDSS